MQENKQQLMKYFSLVLKRRASEETLQGIQVKILNFLSRKDLVAIIHSRYNGKIPPDINLVEMENEGLLNLIEDELFILSYVLQQWCKGIGHQEKKSSKTTPLSNKIASTHLKKSENNGKSVVGISNS